MKRPTKKTPSCRRRRRTNGADQGFVVLSGVRHYLGACDLPESRAAYHRLVAEWSASGGQLPVSKDRVTARKVIQTPPGRALTSC